MRNTYIHIFHITHFIYNTELNLDGHKSAKTLFSQQIQIIDASRANIVAEGTAHSLTAAARLRADRSYRV